MSTATPDIPHFLTQLLTTVLNTTFCQQGTLHGLDKTQTHKQNLLWTSVQTPDLLSEYLFVWGCLRKRAKSSLRVTLNTVV